MRKSAKVIYEWSLSETQIKCLVARFQQENKRIVCRICEKKFTKQSNLSHHFRMQHSEHENKITPQTRSFVKEIFDTGKSLSDQLIFFAK